MNEGSKKSPVPAGVRSMTGFAQARRQEAAGAVTVTIKAVNHRFLDLHPHYPPSLDAWTATIEKGVRARLRRGHIDVTFTIETATAPAPRLNRALIDAYLEAFNTLSRELANPDAQPEVNEILRIPGVLSVESGNAAIPAPEEDSPWHGLLLGTLEDCLDQLDRMRQQEGTALADDLRQRLRTLEAATSEIEKQRETLESHLFSRLQRRMQTLLGESVPGDRLLQEAALVAERSDVTEELTRLRTHLQQFHAMLNDGVEVGRKLDFLLQELNREVNTMLSKTAGVAGEGLRISELGVEMKAEIEKVREQVQNIE